MRAEAAKIRDVADDICAEAGRRCCAVDDVCAGASNFSLRVQFNSWDVTPYHERQGRANNKSFQPYFSSILAIYLLLNGRCSGATTIQLSLTYRGKRNLLHGATNTPPAGVQQTSTQPTPLQQTTTAGA